MSIGSISMFSHSFQFQEDDLAKMTYLNMVESVELWDQNMFHGCTVKCVIILTDGNSTIQNVFRESISRIINGIESDKITNHSTLQIAQNRTITHDDKISTERMLKLYFMIPNLV